MERLVAALAQLRKRRRRANVQQARFVEDRRAGERLSAAHRPDGSDVCRVRDDLAGECLRLFGVPVIVEDGSIKRDWQRRVGPRVLDRDRRVAVDRVFQRGTLQARRNEKSDACGGHGFLQEAICSRVLPEPAAPPLAPVEPANRDANVLDLVDGDLRDRWQADQLIGDELRLREAAASEPEVLIRRLKV